MKKILSFAMVLLVPAFLFLNVWQGYTYYALSDEVAALEKRQKEILEKNMGVIAAIAREQSPLMVEERAASELGLSRIDGSRITRVVVGKNEAQLP